MNVIDVIILLFLGLGTVIGFKKGMISSCVSCVGMFFIVVFSFLLKNPLSNFLYEHFPFFHFFGFFNEISILNILLYEAIAFLLLVILFTILFNIVIKVSNLLDKIVKMTIIFTIPSKLLGAVFGFVEYYLIIFVILFFVNLPIFQVSILEKSKLKEIILTKTPLISEYSKKYNEVANEFIELKEKFNHTEDKEKLHLETIDVFLKYKIITPESLEELIDEGKIEIENIEDVLEKYKKD